VAARPSCRDERTWWRCSACAAHPLRWFADLRNISSAERSCASETAISASRRSLRKYLGLFLPRRRLRRTSTSPAPALNGTLRVLRGLAVARLFGHGCRQLLNRGRECLARPVRSPDGRIEGTHPPPRPPAARARPLPRPTAPMRFVLPPPRPRSRLAASFPSGTSDVPLPAAPTRLRASSDLARQPLGSESKLVTHARLEHHEIRETHRSASSFVCSSAPRWNAAMETFE